MWIFQCCECLANFQARVRCATRFPSRLRSAVDIPAENVHVPDGEEGFEGVGFGVVVSVQPQLSQEFKGVQQCGAVGVGDSGAQPPADGLRRRMQTGTDGRGRRAERGNFASIGLGRKIGFRIQQPFLQDEYRTALLQQVVS